MAIRINGFPVNLESKYPDGTFCLRLPEAAFIGKNENNSECPDTILWNYQGESELVALGYIVNCLREQMGRARIALVMPYVPNARLDRVHKATESFTLKYFARQINGMLFEKVIVLDPHSNVTSALIDRIFHVDPAAFIERAIEMIGKDTILFFPDDGASKRYANNGRPYCFGVKHRDWTTGKIESLEIAGNVDLNGKHVLIVDDICSRGGTAYYSSIALKKAGASKVSAFFSHCENSIFEGKLLDDGVLERIYTTDSIFTGKHEKITVFKFNVADSQKYQ